MNRYTSDVDSEQIKKTNPEAELILEDEDRLILDRTAKIELGGKLRLGGNRLIPNGRTSILRMDENSLLVTKGDFSFFYGADIVIFSGGKLELGKNSYINSDCKVRCKTSISIGNDCAISHDFTVMDADHHAINGLKKEGPVIIGDHVWIGTRVTILKGVTIGKGSVIAAGSVVTKSIPERCMAAGVPAVIIKQDVEWN